MRFNQCKQYNYSVNLHLIMKFSHKLFVMKPICIFQHEDWIQGGRLIEILDERSISYKVVAIDHGEPIPNEVEEMSGLVFLGGTMSVNDEYSWIEDELKLIRKAADKNIPIMGHCLGSQLISKALGGIVQTMSENEIGWHKIKAVENSISKEWLDGIPDNLEVMTWHHDEFSIPDGATHILESPYCKNHAFVIDNILATVAHIEVTISMLQQWLDIHGHDIEPNRSSVQSIAEIKNNIETKISNMHQLTDHFYNKWLQYFTH
jgi:GMP synthase-like glutamine amidotransferase